MRSILAASLFLLASTSAFADAITYSGTLGGTDIIIELTDPSRGPAVGRYSYLKVGADIPLQAIDADDEIRLAEEAPCAPGLCTPDDDGIVANPPIAATWALYPYVGSDTLNGTWTPANGGKALDVVLNLVGRRSLPADTEITPAGLVESVDAMTYGTRTSPLIASPYEMAKMHVAPDEGEAQMLDGSSFRYVTDRRTKFAFPRVVYLADGSDAGPLNAALTLQHGLINYFAFDCLSQAYAGFGVTDDMLGLEYGTLGDFDYENVEMTYLSPTVAGWTEGGSTWCGGAYPNNHYDIYLVETKTGDPLDLSRIFTGWVPRTYGDLKPVDIEIARANPDKYDWGGSPELVEWIRTHRTPAADEAYAAECGLDDLIATNLAIRFAPGDKVIFSIANLRHAIFACTDDVMTVDLADIPELLTPEAKDYFPSLAN